MIRIAAAQTPVSGDVAENGAVIRTMIAEAAAGGARLVLFCEGALSGYAKAQIKAPGDWQTFDWTQQQRELATIAALCGERSIAAVVGGAHWLPEGRPHNSLYVASPQGKLLTRYDKRFLSHSEISDWYVPGRQPVTFEIDGYRFGCAICIEVQFPEIFAEYERLGVDAVLFASYGITDLFPTLLRAHAGLNCLWIAGATPAQKAHKGPAGIIGPDGNVVAHAAAEPVAAMAIAVLDRTDRAWDVPLNKARPWRRAARQGDIYREEHLARMDRPG
jgi:predicted amidohydrolase